MEGPYRQENHLQLWILAAKGLPHKRRLLFEFLMFHQIDEYFFNSFFCDIWLDKKPYWKTGPKQKTNEECFWGESFESQYVSNDIINLFFSLILEK